MNNSGPLIGITTDFKDNHNSIEEAYSKAVVHNGGLPVLIPTVEQQRNYLVDIVRRIDGLLLPGSRDMDPHFYEEEPHPKLNPMSRERTEAEFMALEMAIEHDKPVLGICGGMQFINVFYGGSLFQDIQALVKNPLLHENGEEHQVEIKEGSTLYKIVGEKVLNVKSYHHQAVNRLGKELTVSAVSPDGIIEGLECDRNRLLAVQWHPELEYKDTSKKLFEYFVSSCSGK